VESIETRDGERLGEIVTPAKLEHAEKLASGVD
jgi:hypothetical protein